MSSACSDVALVRVLDFINQLIVIIEFLLVFEESRKAIRDLVLSDVSFCKLHLDHTAEGRDCKLVYTIRRKYIIRSHVKIHFPATTKFYFWRCLLNLSIWVHLTWMNLRDDRNFRVFTFIIHGLLPFFFDWCLWSRLLRLHSVFVIEWIFFLFARRLLIVGIFLFIDHWFDNLFSPLTIVLWIIRSST
jgi:hypothetical protein